MRSEGNFSATSEANPIVLAVLILALPPEKQRLLCAMLRDTKIPELIDAGDKIEAALNVREAANA